VNFDPARRIADAVLYEGYILYPYRASAQKNRLRWQFGVIAPQVYNDQRGSDPWATQTECLLEFDSDAILHLKLRFLQLQARNIEEAVDAEGKFFRRAGALEIDGTSYITWEEGLEREIEAEIELRTVFDTDKTVAFELEGNENEELVFNAAGKLAARIVRQSWPVSGRLIIGAWRVSGLSSVAKLRIRVENTRQCDQPFREREEAVRHSLVATHLLLGVDQGRFVSLLEPPDWAREVAGSCVNLHTWPVLVGEKEPANLLLSAPIILYDYPQVAPESSGDFFDATEIDELLALRTMTLTDVEKREAKFTDGRGATVLNRIETMPVETFARLHGTMRELRGTTGTEEEAVWVGGIQITIGSKVRLCPRMPHTDAQDIFLEGRVAIVKRILRDVENKSYLAVTLVDDPAADLHEWYGRFHYFSPDEVEPAIESQSATRRFDNSNHRRPK
jgi:hypothetical protein